MPADNVTLPDDFRDFINALQKFDVECVLVGGYAVGAHGRVRATVDIDFLYRASPENVDRVCRALRHFGAPASAADPAFLGRDDSIVQVGVAPNRIDLIASITGRTFDQVWSGAISVSIDGERVRTIGFADLLINKRATARPQDLEDARLLSSRRKR